MVCGGTVCVEALGLEVMLLMPELVTLVDEGSLDADTACTVIPVAFEKKDEPLAGTNGTSCAPVVDITGIENDNGSGDV